jgi:hypothetical protein
MNCFRVVLYQTVVQKRTLDVEAPDKKTAERLAEEAVFGGMAEVNEEWEAVNVIESGVAESHVLATGSTPDVPWEPDGREILEMEEDG